VLWGKVGGQTANGDKLLTGASHISKVFGGGVDRGGGPIPNGIRPGLGTLLPNCVPPPQCGGPPLCAKQCELSMEKTDTKDVQESVVCESGKRFCRESISPGGVLVKSQTGYSENNKGMCVNQPWRALVRPLVPQQGGSRQEGGGAEVKWGGPGNSKGTNTKRRKWDGGMGGGGGGDSLVWKSECR